MSINKESPKEQGKIEYSSLPSSMAKMEMYGFSWHEFVAGLPSRLQRFI
ncbi:MAG: hypothetical protein LBQ33_05285 [Oscillospiraceae bacterium]|jgi:hypothetical protein|nr:hypothetical protein [Oscillospiraceae bacterium]